jgi:hypothetical protein
LSAAVAATPGSPYLPWGQFPGPQVFEPILSHPDLSQGEKLCYAQLVRRGGKTGDCFCSLERLAGDLSRSCRQVIRYIQRLVGLGFLRRNRRGLNLTNTYEFLKHPSLAETKEEKRPAAQSPTEVPAPPCQPAQAEPPPEEQPAILALRRTIETFRYADGTRAKATPRLVGQLLDKAGHYGVTVNEIARYLSERRGYVSTRPSIRPQSPGWFCQTVETHCKALQQARPAPPASEPDPRPLPRNETVIAEMAAGIASLAKRVSFSRKKGD